MNQEEAPPETASAPTPESDPLSLAIDDHGLAWLTFGEAATHVTTRLLRALDEHLATVEGLIAEGRVRAVVVRRSSLALFLAGEDLRELLGVEDAAQAVERSVTAQRTLRRLEQLPVPTVAAIGGACLGAGLELALACSYRVAAAGTAWFAFPQLRYGLIPGLGGTVRLPRLIGLQESMRFILAAESHDAGRAQELGMVDALLPGPELRARAAAFALDRVDRGRMRTGARRAMTRRLFEDTAPGRRLIFSRAVRGLIPRLPFPAAALHGALQSVAEGIARPLDSAFRHESELYGETVTSEPARALIRFELLQEAAGADRPPATPVGRVAVLGAGDRGAELAHLLARAGIPVRLKDRKRGAIASGAQAVRDRLAEAQARDPQGAKRAPADEDLVTGAAGFGGFGTLDLVVAAVGDRSQVIRFALREAEEHVSDRCVFAATSPTVSIAEIEHGLRDPSRLVGLITATPAEIFPVAEIVRGTHTTDDAVRTASDAARRVGLTPLPVADRPGFLVHRLLAVQLAEAVRLLDEGASVEIVDGALEEFGFRMGPLSRIDAMGTERALRLLEGLAGSLGARVAPGDALKRVHERGARFYRYRNGRRVRTEPGITPGRESPPREEIRDRLLLIILNEAVKALAEGVADTPAEMDLAAVLGLGFPEDRGGILYYADRSGLAAVTERLEALATEHGERFRVAPLLRETAAGGGSLARIPGSAAGHVTWRVLR